MLCRAKRKEFPLDDISAVRGLKKGHDGINVNTVHYKVEINFTSNTPVKILESIYREKVRKQVYVINKFLFGICPPEAL